MKVKGYRWVLLASYMYLAALTQLFWLNFAAIETYMEDRLHLLPSQVIWLSLVFVIVMVVLAIPSGIVLDKKGFKFSIGLGTFFIGLFPLVRLISPDSFIFLLIGQIGIAIGEPFIINAVTKLAILWFPKKEEARAIGLGSLALFIGMMVSLGATPWLVHHLSYEWMLIIYSGLGIIGIFIFLFFIKPDPILTTKDIPLEFANFKSVSKILQIKNYRLLCIVSFLGFSVFNGLITWFEKILFDEHSLSLTQIGNVSAILMLSGIIGCIVIPYLSDKFQTRKSFLLINILVIMLCLALLIFIKNYNSNIFNAIFLGFFLISSLPIILTMSTEITGARLTGVGVGFIQLIGNVGGVILIWLMEQLRTQHGNYAIALCLNIILLLIALLFAIGLKDTATSQS